jgi:hypothetical protein
MLRCACTVFPDDSCEALGSELLRQSPDCNPNQNFGRSLNAVGFEVAKQGEPAIRSTFDKLAEMADGALDLEARRLWADLRQAEQILHRRR